MMMFGFQDPVNCPARLLGLAALSFHNSRRNKRADH
jgi:hypothetical protein